MSTTKRFSPEVRHRAVRLVLEHQVWVAWFSTQRLLEPLGDLPPAEYENQYTCQPATPGAELLLT